MKDTETIKKTTYEKTHYVLTLDKIPNATHFAALIQSSHTHMDQWSDMNNGQPFNVTDQVLEYVAFDDEEALNDFILKDQGYNRKKYRIFRVNPIEVKLHTTLEIK